MAVVVGREMRRGVFGSFLSLTLQRILKNVRILRDSDQCARLLFRLSLSLSPPYFNGEFGSRELCILVSCVCVCVWKLLDLM